MLADLESKFGAIVSNGLAAHAHLDVATGAALAPSAGRGSVGVGVSSIAPESGFTPSDSLLVGSPDAPQSRRVLPVSFVANVAFLLRPSADTLAGRTEARALILEDVSATAHLLNDPAVLDGSAFAVAASDPGFLVDRLSFESGQSVPELDDGLFSATLGFKGEARIWPVGIAQEEGVITQLDALASSLPLRFTVAQSALPPDAQTRIGGALGALRRDDGEENSDPASIAVNVQADVPISERGTMLGGAVGVEAGVRIFPLGEDGVLDILYQAPSGDPGPNGRTESVAVHLAKPDGRRGLFLGSTAIRLLPAP